MGPAPCGGGPCNGGAGCDGPLTAAAAAPGGGDAGGHERRVAGAVDVVVGTSEHAQDAELVQRVAAMVNESYATALEDPSVLGENVAAAGCGSAKKPHSKIDEREVRERLTRGDLGADSNRVLHLALRREDGCVVGCASSTVTTAWTPKGCGHWGLLVVAREAQGTGVASALVAAAEARLLEMGCHEVQIEYEYGPSHPYSERLRGWYEDKLGFTPTTGWLKNRLLGMLIGRGGTEFRRSRKALAAA